MNSFRAVERAIAFEIERQAAALGAGEALLQETRGWSEPRGETYRMRVKETSDDYRYFPEPDLPPLHLNADWLAGIRAELPELPSARLARYIALGLSQYDANVIVHDLAATRVFESLLEGHPDLPVKVAANWVTGEFMRLRRKYPEHEATFLEQPGGLGELIELAIAETITPATAKEVFETHFASATAVAKIVGDGNLRKMDDNLVAAAVDGVLMANPAAIADYRGGKAQAVGFLVGQVMKATGGQADAALVQAAIRDRLEADRTEEG